MSTGNTDDTGADAFSIAQLASLANVPQRRIRFYVQEELLAPPAGRGRAAHYTREHLQRLYEINAMRDMNLGLHEIRRRLGPLPSQQESQGLSVGSQRWIRWEINASVELSAREDLSHDEQEKVEILLRVARELLRDDINHDED